MDLASRNIWFKGKIIPADQAVVYAMSPSALYGLNVFEGIRCYWNDQQEQLYAFRLNDHLSRLANSARLMGIPTSHGSSEVKEIFLETLRFENRRADMAVRVTFFVDGEGSWSSTARAELMVAPIERRRAELKSYTGLSACVSSWTRISDNVLPPRIKTGANYINGRYGHLEARRNGYAVPLFLGSNGKMSEGAGACLFIVRGGTLITTTLTSSVLESITRSTLLELAEEEGIPVCEREIDRTELYLADEVFLCGSSAEITSIAAVDKILVGNGTPGTITQILFKKYFCTVNNENSDRQDWLTPIFER